MNTTDSEDLLSPLLWHCLTIFLPAYSLPEDPRVLQLPIHVDCYLSDLRYNYNKEQQEQVMKEISQIRGLI